MNIVLTGLRGTGKSSIGAVLVTHTHIDHAPLANQLATEASVPAIGHDRGPGFEPDIRLADGDTWVSGRVTLEVVHTPGHATIEEVAQWLDGFGGDFIRPSATVYS